MCRIDRLDHSSLRQCEDVLAVQDAFRRVPNSNDFRASAIFTPVIKKRDETILIGRAAFETGCFDATRQGCTGAGIVELEPSTALFHHVDRWDEIMARK